MNNEDKIRRDKLENIAKLVNDLLIDMDDDIEESNEERPKRKRGLGYVGEKPENQGKKWTQEMNDDLRAFVAAEWSHARIAGRMKRPKKAISEQLRVLRVRDGL